MSRPAGAKNLPAVMTFQEIARELGISKNAAWISYDTAMKKIRRQPDSIRQLQNIVQFRQTLEDRRLASGFGVEQ